MLETAWYILGLPSNRSGVLGSTVPRLSRRSRLCFTVVLIFFFNIVWSPQFLSLPQLVVSCLQLISLWVLICLRQLWGILSLWPEQWCIQGSVTLVGCIASDFPWTSCTDPWLLFYRQWSLRLLQNFQLLPWTFWSMMCILDGWSVHLSRHVLGEQLFIYDLLVYVIGPFWLHLICSLCHKHGWLLHICRPWYCLPRQVIPFMFLESLLFNFSFWIMSNSHSYPCYTWDISPHVFS